jgi:hypothetical protein
MPCAGPNHTRLLLMAAVARLLSKSLLELKPHKSKSVLNPFRKNRFDSAVFFCSACDFSRRV